MNKKNSKKINILPNTYHKILISVFILIWIALFLIYGIKLDGFSSLLHDLKESTSVLGYILAVIIILFIFGVSFGGNYKVKKKTYTNYNGATYDIIEETKYIKKSEKDKIKEEQLREQDVNMLAKSGHNTNPKIVNVDKFIKEYKNLNSLRKKVIEIAKHKIKGKSVVIKDTQTLTDFNEKGLTKTFSGRTVEEKLQSVDVLEEVLEEGIYYNTSYDINDVNGIKYHNFLTPVKAYNKKGNAFIRNVIKEFTKQSDINDKFYYHQFEYIDNNKNETIRSISSTNDEQRTLGLPRSNNNIPQSNNKVKPLPTC